LRDNLQALKSSGTRLDHLLVLGGGAQSRHWVKMIATVLNLRLALPEAGELGAAMGAARLAICAVTAQNPATVMTPPQIAEIIDPDPALVGAFDAAYGRYKTVYPALKALL